MALQSSDLFYVQRGADGYKMQAGQIFDFIAGSPVVVYRGTVDATAAPTGQIDPNPPLPGDVYINTGTGTVATGWTGSVGADITDGQRVIWDGAAWEIVGQAAGGGVETVGGTAPINVDSTDPANPVVSIDVATNAAFGSTRLAQDPPVAGDLASTSDTDVLSVPHFNELAGRITTAAGGGTQDVVGVDPIEASQDNVTLIATVSIKDATVVQKGAVILTSTVDGTDTKAATPKAINDYTVPLNLTGLTELV